ncbi:MAG: RsmG family class I SAM-dependent methyltransferase [Ilumatobacteraceae bacterium]
MTDDTRLLDALEGIRQRGAIGETSLVAAVAHAEQFVGLIPSNIRDLADLGSGGGLPGLVIAWRAPSLEVLLIERRATRADLLRRAVSALGMAARVHVVTADVRTVAQARGHVFDVVTARSFAAPAVTAAHAASLLRFPGGVALISEPPSPDAARWPVDMLASHGLVDDGVHAGIRRLLRV